MMFSSATERTLIDGLRDPSSLASLDLRQWNELLPMARGAGVLASLAVRLDELGLSEKIPPQVQPHLESSRTLAARHEAVVRWEVNRIASALADVPTPIVLLKGAAYLMAGLSSARGRLYSDVDILVNAAQLEATEQALQAAGWVAGSLDERNAQYFRTWLHELPPMRHRRRQTTLDVHHTILPRTDRLKLDPKLLIDAAVPVADHRVKVLAPADMVLHSAAHLFRNGRFAHALRDLWDVHGMLEQFGRDSEFWPALLGRAELLNLQLPCFCGLRYSAAMFGTTIPTDIERSVYRWHPRWPGVRIIDALVRHASRPPGLDDRDRLRTLSQSLLAHWPVPRLRTMATGLFWTKRLPPAQAHRG